MPTTTGNAGGPGPQFTRAYTATADDLMSGPPGSPIPFTASTPGVKKDGMNLRANGWRTDNFRQSGGPILWNHDHNRPAIGAGVPAVETERLRMSVVFDQEDPFAAAIESKVRRKFLRAASVGWDFTDGRGKLLDHVRMSMDYLCREAFYELSETSIVNVPADPTALAERHRSAMRSLSRELASLYDDQERTDSTATEEQVRHAVGAELVRLGIPLSEHELRTGLVRRDRLPSLLRAVGVQARGASDHPAPAGEGPPASAGVDIEAARAVLAVFPTLKGES